MSATLQQHIHHLPIAAQVSGADRARTGTYASWKRAVDLALSCILLVPAVPLMVLGMALVRLTSRGPALYSQVRLGLHGRRYRIYKIRSMTDRCESQSGPRWSTPGDPRVTAIGRFLRATHLDELPQLWNVIRGDMSLVGPRPERPEFVGELERLIPHYSARMLVRPGITGLAQVQLPPDSDLESVRRKVACDLYYLRSLSLSLDLRILLSTMIGVVGLPFVVSRKLLRVPSGEPIESAYQDLIAGDEAASQARLA